MYTMARKRTVRDQNPEYIIGFASFRPFDDDGTPPRQLRKITRQKIVAGKKIRKLKS